MLGTKLQKHACTQRTWWFSYEAFEWWPNSRLEKSQCWIHPVTMLLQLQTLRTAVSRARTIPAWLALSRDIPMKIKTVAMPTGSIKAEYGNSRSGKPPKNMSWWTQTRNWGTPLAFALLARSASPVIIQSWPSTRTVLSCKQIHRGWVSNADIKK